MGESWNLKLPVYRFRLYCLVDGFRIKGTAIMLFAVKQRLENKESQ